MISARKLAANRANAQKSTGPRTPAGKLRSAQNAQRSTGPRTAAGKARAARNALRHGLTLPALCDPAATSGIAVVARAVAATDADPERYALAWRVAAAQIDHVRARQAHRDLLQYVFEHSKGLARLEAIDRYERRALSRRKFAIRALDAARLQAASGPTAFLSKRSEPKTDGGMNGAAFSDKTNRTQGRK